MNRRYGAATIVAAGFFGGSFAVLAWQPPGPHLLWNASESAPIGLYRVERGADIRTGDLVAIRPPADIGNFLARRHYLPAGLPLLKRVAALPGARVCRSGVFVTIDGAGVARALPRDQAGRPLPVWHGCRTVDGQQVFLINAPPQSLDSRYFGPLPTSGLIGIVRPILIRDRSGAPLRWHRAPREIPHFSDRKE